MAPTLHECCGASLALPTVPELGDLRGVPGIAVACRGDRAWVRWEAGDEEVLRRLLPLPGVELFALREGLWYRPGRHLPEFGLPFEAWTDAVPLGQALVPAPVRAAPSRGNLPPPARLRLVREEVLRPSTALRCKLTELGRWIEGATTAQVASLEASQSGGRAWLLGRRLPALAGGERFWGSGILIPAGFRAEPALPDSALRRASGVRDGEVLVLDHEGGEVLTRDAFRPLTRAGVRLSLGSP